MEGTAPSVNRHGKDTALNLFHTAQVPPGEGPFPTLIALHGWGASAHDLLGLAPAFPGDVLALCPQGKVEVPIGPGAHGYGWFPLVRGQPPEAEAFLEASRDLRAFVDGAAGRYPVDRERQLLLGFSQGGLMSYELALAEPGRFAGAVILSSWLPEILSNNLPRLPEQRNFPILVIHGDKDEMVPVERARESKRVLEDFAVDLTYQEFPMGHEIRPDALRLVLRWWQDKVMSRT